MPGKFRCLVRIATADGSHVRDYLARAASTRDGKATFDGGFYSGEGRAGIFEENNPSECPLFWPIAQLVASQYQSSSLLWLRPEVWRESGHSYLAPFNFTRVSINFTEHPG